LYGSFQCLSIGLKNQSHRSWFMGWNEAFTKSVEERSISIGIIGLGYVGLPTAIGFFDAGFTVWGVDISERTVSYINAQKNPTGDPEVEGLIPHASDPRWNITTKTQEAVPHCDVILVTVPTPITEDLKPDLSYVRNAGCDVFDAVERGSRTIVVLESTVYPGVTAQTWLPELEKRGLVNGVDVELAYCPERFNPGDPAHGVRQVARVVGCSSDEVGQDLVAMYRHLTSEDVRYVGKIEVAEASKVIENVQRDINIALVNELARIFPELDLDVEDVLDAASTKWNFHRYTPGVGVGGHCIPVDPYYMMQRAQDVGVPAELITAARAVNRTMPQHVAQVIEKILYTNHIPAGQGRVLFLGWSYKPGVGDPRETPAEPLAKALQSRNIHVSVWDPHLGEQDLPDFVQSVNPMYDEHTSDIAVLITAHQEFLNLDWEALGATMKAKRVYDGRRVLDLDRLASSGWETFAVGMPIRNSM